MTEPKYEPLRCLCTLTRIVRRPLPSGLRVYRQCLACGKGEQLKKKAFPNAAFLPLWDDGVVERWRQRQAAHNEAFLVACLAAQEARNREFWERYDRHLKSEKWANLRRKVFARCCGMCEGCGERVAVQIHHLTYKRLGNEMLFDLAAVCLSCHEAIHPHMREEEA